MRLFAGYADHRHQDRSDGMLAAIAAQVTGELVTVVLSLALQVRSSFGMEQILEALIPNLDKGLLPQIVSVVPAAGTLRDGLCALLAPRLDGQMLDRLFAVGRERDIFAAECIEALSPYLPPELLDRADPGCGRDAQPDSPERRPEGDRTTPG